MCKRDKMDSCNFCDGGLQFFSRTALIILPQTALISTNKDKAKKTQVRSQEKAFVFSKNLTAHF